MSGLRARLAEALGGEFAFVSVDRLADVLLALPGIAAVELPEPDEGGNYWYGRNHVFVDSDGRVMTKFGADLGDVEEVREMAVVLLAAVNAAEAK